MKGCTLEELSTRETEMSVHETSFMVSQRSKARGGSRSVAGNLNDSNITIESKSDRASQGLFSSFFQSLVKPPQAEDSAKDPEADDDISSCDEDITETEKTISRKSKLGVKGEYH